MSVIKRLSTDGFSPRCIMQRLDSSWPEQRTAWEAAGKTWEAREARKAADQCRVVTTDPGGCSLMSQDTSWGAGETLF